MFKLREKIAIIMLALTFVFSSSVITLAKPVQSKDEKKQSNSSSSINQKGSTSKSKAKKGPINNQQLLVITKELGKIKENLVELSTKIDAYFSSPTPTDTSPTVDQTSDPSTDPTQTGVQTQDSTTVNSGQTQTSAVDSNTSTGLGTTTDAQAAVDTAQTGVQTQDPLTVDNGQTQTATVDPNAATDLNTTSISQTQGDTSTGTLTEGQTLDTTESAAELENAANTEVEKEEKEFDEKQSGVSLVGKLNALNNRLQAVEKKLQSLPASADPEGEMLSAVKADIQLIKEEIKTDISKMQGLQSTVLKKLNDKLNTEEIIPAVKVVAPDKEWSIQFNPGASTEMQKQLDILIVDSNQNVVPATTSYDEHSKTLKVKPVENYKSGETYTLFITEGIQGKGRVQLKKSVKAQFTVQ